MKVLGVFLTACVVLAVAQAAAVALVVMLGIVILYSAFVYPRETFGFFGFCIIAGLIERQPLGCAIFLIVLACLRLIGNAVR